MTAAPRIAPLTPPHPPELEEQLRRWMPPGTAIEPLALFRTLAIHPELFSRMRPLGAGILAHGHVRAREREIVIHRTCARASAVYEWGVHGAFYSPRVGLSDAQLRDTAMVPFDPALWGERDVLLLRLCDELHERATVSDEVWAPLAEHFSDEQLLELVITAGWYRLIAYVANAARVPLESWAVPWPHG